MDLENLIKNIEIKKATKLESIGFTDDIYSYAVFLRYYREPDGCVYVYENDSYEQEKIKFIIKFLKANNIIYNYNDLKYLQEKINSIIKEEIANESHLKAKYNRESLYNCLIIDFSNFEDNFNKKLLAEVTSQKELKLIKISTIGITTNSFSVEDIQTNIKEIGFAKENTMLVNNKKVSLENYYNDKYTDKNIERINGAIDRGGDFIYIVLKNNINQITQISNITSMLYVLLYSEIGYLQSEILDYQSLSYDTEKSIALCYIYNKKTTDFHNLNNNAPIFEIPFESTIVNNWFSDYKALGEDHQKRIMNFSFNLYKSFTLQETDRFDNICKAIDSLFGIDKKVTDSIKINLKKIRNEFLTNSGVITSLPDSIKLQDSIKLTNKKIEIYWKIRNDLVHGEIKDIKDSVHYIEYYSLYGKNIENDFLDILFLVLKHSTKYFKNNMFIE